MTKSKMLCLCALSIYALTIQVGCVSAAINAFKKIPNEKEISEMKTGITKMSDVKEKYSSPDSTAVVAGKVCLNWIKMSAMGSVGISGGHDQVVLCFVDGLLADKTSVSQ